jgi:hypothetical protein
LITADQLKAVTIKSGPMSSGASTACERLAQARPRCRAACTYAVMDLRETKCCASRARQGIAHGISNTQYRMIELLLFVLGRETVRRTTLWSAVKNSQATERESIFRPSGG